MKQAARRKVSVERVDAGEPVDVPRWAERYVAAVLELEGFTPASGSATATADRMGPVDPHAAARSC